MDTIRLEIIKSSDDDAGEEVRIFINDRNLIDMLREVELPFAEAEDAEEIAGAYGGLDPRTIFLPSRYLLDKPLRGEKVAVLGCPGCIVDCWPFDVRITINDDTVVWSDFEQPHRRTKENRPGWSYEQLGTFVFDKAQYLAELAKPGFTLEPGHIIWSSLFQDPEYGWSVRFEGELEYFPTDVPLTLLVGGESFDARVTDVTRIFWGVWNAPSIGNPGNEQRTFQESSTFRLLYLPTAPMVLYTWMNEWFDLDRLFTEASERPEYDPANNPDIQTAQGLRRWPFVPVLVQTLEPHQRYQLIERPDIEFFGKFLEPYLKPLSSQEGPAE